MFELYRNGMENNLISIFNVIILGFSEKSRKIIQEFPTKNLIQIEFSLSFSEVRTKYMSLKS